MRRLREGECSDRERDNDQDDIEQVHPISLPRRHPPQCSTRRMVVLCGESAPPSVDRILPVPDDGVRTGERTHWIESEEGDTMAQMVALEGLKGKETVAVVVYEAGKPAPVIADSRPTGRG